MLQKLGPGANAVNWFEIPVTDTERARKFYETILDIKMETQRVAETNEELTFFPFDPGVVRATSGKVTGALVKNDKVKPSDTGITVYLNASPSIQAVLDRVVPAGGKIIQPKILIKAGWIAMILDSEGNRIGLHAEE